MIIMKKPLDERIYDVELGKGVSSTEYIFEKYFKAKNSEDYFISFTEIDKLGINPQSKYKTPIGIYTYPVREFFEEYVGCVRNQKKLFHHELLSSIGEFAPFAGSNPYVWVVKMNINDKEIFNISDYSLQDYKKDKEQLKELIFSTFKLVEIRDIIEYMTLYELIDYVIQILIDEFNYDKKEASSVVNSSPDIVSSVIMEDKKIFNMVIDKVIEDMGNDSKFVDSLSGKIWNIIRLISDRNPIKWNKIFRQLGYMCAVDREGYGVIHDNEKIQAVFFSKKGFNIVDKIENIRKSETSISINEILKNIESILSTKNFDKKVFNKLILKLEEFLLNTNDLKSVSQFICNFLEKNIKFDILMDAYFYVLNLAHENYDEYIFVLTSVFEKLFINKYIWLYDAQTHDANYDVSKIENQLVWKNGIWEDGTWEYGKWKMGTWEVGVWKSGIWEDGTWEGGVWKYGLWKDGEWQGGERYDGIWEAGVWKDGIWYGGVWYDGIWYDGIWEAGTWKDGKWVNGLWKNGTWKGGKIWNPNIEDFEYSSKNPNETEWSLSYGKF